MKHVNNQILLTLTFFILTAACGSSGGSQRGFTACASLTCQPGQYCAGGVVCENGCTSDINCLDNQRCDTSTTPGTCLNNVVMRTDGAVVSNDAATINDSGPPVSSVGAVVCPVLIRELQSCAGQTLTMPACEMLFAQGQSRGCNTAWMASLARHVQTAPTPFTCMNFGGIRDLVPASNDENVFLGLSCPTAVANANCYSISCRFDSDCTGDSRCNSRTEHCVQRTGSCLGLPCRFDSDCPTSQTCNSSLSVCVRR